jgi:hypothetical protein
LGDVDVPVDVERAYVSVKKSGVSVCICH